ncbi:MAG: hypothetical protein M1834_004628 [Cirrosporium novae-zelandiae]|nr:MAG: hypothetical protein M1834_004628 [Cirrosporium novae-zelandiae]
MSNIIELPKNTITAIGSSQVLTDASSVIKELVENALDAKATSISVEISTNTLDAIQVKDNGHGISPEGQSILCKRHCTSKIRNLDDLRKIGGTSLGFRGEALASATELSRQLVVTTRVEGEPVAASLSFGRNGELLKQEKKSHPVGTTIRISDFLKSLPVRRQTALKTSPKVMKRIKNMLISYALARPGVRVSLKFLKAKNGKDDWIYAPKANATALEAAMMIFGKHLSKQYLHISKVIYKDILENSQEETSSNDNDHNCREEQNMFRIDAVLPNPDIELASLSDGGRYLSIDSRPVSCARGNLKEVSSVCKKYIRSLPRGPEGCKVPSDPFFYMNIQCPPGSYDPNVEPAKDDVLFANPQNVVKAVEQLLKETYGTLPGGFTSAAEMCPRPLKSINSFNLLLARKVPVVSPETEGGDDLTRLESSTKCPGSLDPPQSDSASLSHPSSAKLQGKAIPPQQKTQDWRPNMFSTEEEDLLEVSINSLNPSSSPQSEGVDEGGEDSESDLQDIRISNPWTIARLNAPVRPSVFNPLLSSKSPRRESVPSETEMGLNHSPQSQVQLMTPARERKLAGSKLKTPFKTPFLRSDPTGLPTPGQTQLRPRTSEMSSSVKGFEELKRKSILKRRVPVPQQPSRNSIPESALLSEDGGEEGEDDDDDDDQEHRVRSSRRTRKGNKYGDGIGAIDTWVQKSLHAREVHGRWQQQRREARKGRLEQKGISSQEQDDSPIMDDYFNSLTTLPQQIQPSSTKSKPFADFSSAISSQSPSPNPPLSEILAFETRKRDAIKKYKSHLTNLRRSQPPSPPQPPRLNLRSPSLSPQKSQSNPHEARYNTAISALRQQSPPQIQSPITTFPTENNNAPPSPNTNPSPTHESLPRLRRRRTSRLPLEHTPPSQTVYLLVLTISLPNPPFETITSLFNSTATIDAYISTPLPPTPEKEPEVELETKTGFNSVGRETCEQWEEILRRLLLVPVAGNL